jgi:hypothetical protein
MSYSSLLLDGAALFYVSKNSHKSIELFKEYLLHLAFSIVEEDASCRLQVSCVFPFSQNAIISDRERIFVPLGWDSRAKISTLGDFDFAALSTEEGAIKAFREVIGKLDTSLMVLDQNY